MRIDPSQITPAMRKAMERPASLKQPGVHNMPHPASCACANCEAKRFLDAQPKATIHLEQCEECHGIGHCWYAGAKEPQPCPECDGKGTIEKTVWTQKSMQDSPPSSPAPHSRPRKAKRVPLPPVVAMAMAGVDPFYTPNASKYLAGMERKLQSDIRNYLTLHGIEFINPPMNKRSSLPPGWCDFSLAYRGVPVAIEAKTEVGKLEPEQAALHPKLAKAGWRVIVARSVADVQALFRAIDEEISPTIKL